MTSQVVLGSVLGLNEDLTVSWISLISHELGLHTSIRLETQFSMLMVSAGGSISSFTVSTCRGRIRCVPRSVSLACLYADNLGLTTSLSRLISTV